MTPLAGSDRRLTMPSAQLVPAGCAGGQPQMSARFRPGSPDPGRVHAGPLPTWPKAARA